MRVFFSPLPMTNAARSLTCSIHWAVRRTLSGSACVGSKILAPRDRTRGVSDPWLSPPVVQIDASLAWVLRAAFAADLPDSLPEHPKRALHLARKLEVSARIAARLLPIGRSASSLFERELDLDFRTNIAVDALLSQGLEDVLRVASLHSTPVVALKYAALRLGKITQPGTRVAADLDLLVPAAAASSLAEALLTIGFRRTGTRSHAHQLEALVGPYGAVVELHLHIPGVQVANGGFATVRDLFDAQMVAPAEGACASLPTPALLAAHALAHGLLQNRATPQSYSLLRMLSDLADLRRRQPEGLLSSAARHLSPPIAGLCVAAEDLSVKLSRGVFEGSSFDSTPAQQLLSHCLGARLDAEYSRRLRSAGFANLLRNYPTAPELLRFLKGSLVPPEPELDAIYGPATSKFARLRRRWRRPFDLTLRAARHWARTR